MPPRVEFDEETVGSYRPPRIITREVSVSVLSRFLQKIGIPTLYINRVLIIMAAVLFGLAVIIFLANKSDTSYRSKKFSPEEQRKLLEIMPTDRPPMAPVNH